MNAVKLWDQLHRQSVWKFSSNLARMNAPLLQRVVRLDWICWNMKRVNSLNFYKNHYFYLKRYTIPTIIKMEKTIPPYRIHLSANALCSMNLITLDDNPSLFATVNNCFCVFCRKISKPSRLTFAHINLAKRLFQLESDYQSGH
jgi:hypothetical protein